MSTHGDDGESKSARLCVLTTLDAKGALMLLFYIIVPLHTSKGGLLP